MKTSLESKIAQICIVIGLTIVALICSYPFYYILIYSVSIPSEAVRGVYWIPAGFTMQNYIEIFRQNDILHAAFISVSRTILGTALGVFCTSLFAFLLTQQRLRFRMAIYRLVVVTMFLNAGLIPWYVTMVKLGFKNNFLLYIIPSAIGAFYLILVKTYMEQIPPALQEAAMIDGAGPFKIYYKIIFPVSMPVIATIAIFMAVDQWNTWLDNFYLADIAQLQTLQKLLLGYLADQQAMVMSAMSKMQQQSSNSVKVTPTSIRMTITMVVMLPVLLIYPIFQKYFVKGIMIGAVKG